VSFGGSTRAQLGDCWWTWYRWIPSKYRTELSITFASVATHNHFVLNRGGVVFKQSAPVIKLPSGASEEEHLELLGLLNSSTACFWLKQVCHNKGGGGVNEGFRGDLWEFFFDFSGTRVAQFPLASERPLELARRLDACATELASIHPGVLEPRREHLAEARHRAEEIRNEMVALQEELDWASYRSYGLLEDDLTAPGGDVPFVRPGERAFEFVLARRVAAGGDETTWFERHGTEPTVELPADWPEPYRKLVQRRMDTIEANGAIGLIERPEYKRRWQWESW
jgi:hypothetical protein